MLGNTFVAQKGKQPPKKEVAPQVGHFLSMFCVFSLNFLLSGTVLFTSLGLLLAKDYC